MSVGPPSESSATVVRFRDGVPEVQPLTTVADLLRWAPTGDDCLCQPILPLPQRRDGGLGAARPRVLACHDMRGGYLEDRLVQGGGDADAYTFRHWAAVDGLVYFSHRLVSVPPPGWTNAGHLHGVEVLGTLITEWDAGAAACAEMFGSQDSAERTAAQLARLAAHLGFDGWLINIENEVDVENVPHLLHFLRRLTAAMHEAAPHSKVIWYDAVTVDGKLDWQNALTAQNAAFLDATDGIWLNYTWLPPALGQARAAAGARQWDVYAGVDCFGRGTYGGGGLQCNLALHAAKEAGLSAALFGVGWGFEMHGLGTADAHEAVHAANTPEFSWHRQDEAFWRLVVRAWGVQRAVLCTLPTTSDFCVGAGRTLAHAGRALWPGAWYHLSLQSLQPGLAFRGAPPEGLRAELTSDAAYNGGGSMRLVGEVTAPATLRLFRAAAEVPTEGLRVSFTAAASRGVTLRLCLRLQRSGRDARGADGAGASYAVEVGPPGSTGAGAAMQGGTGGRCTFRPASRAGEVPFAAPGAGPVSPGKAAGRAGGWPQHWATWRCALSAAELPEWALDGSVLTAVDVVAGPAVSGASCQCNCFLGEVSITPRLPGFEADESSPQRGGVESLAATRVEVRSGTVPGGGAVAALRTVLTWAFRAGRPQRCHVWVKFSEAAGGSGAPSASPSKPQWGPPRWLGAACAPAFAVAGLVLPAGASAACFLVATGASAGALRQALAVTVALQD